MQKKPDFQTKIQPYYLISRLLTCIQKVCKKTEIHAKIWPYIKNSNMHSKCMQKKTKIHANKAKEPDFHAKIQPCIKNSNLHSIGM